MLLVQARVMTRSPSDPLQMPTLANSRAHLHPLISPSPPPPESLPTFSSVNLLGFPIAATACRSILIRGDIAHHQPSFLPPPLRPHARSPPPPPPRSPPPPWTVRNIHRRLIQRVFTSQRVVLVNVVKMITIGLLSPIHLDHIPRRWSPLLLTDQSNLGHRAGEASSVN
jgi:hypothetical protein